MYTAVMQYRLHSAGSRPEPLLPKKKYCLVSELNVCTQTCTIYTHVFRVSEWIYFWKRKRMFNFQNLISEKENDDLSNGSDS